MPNQILRAEVKLKQDDLARDIEAGVKYLKRQKNYGAFEQVSIQAFKQLDKAISNFIEKNILQQLKEALHELISVKNKKQLPLGLQELMIWVEKKLESV